MVSKTFYRLYLVINTNKVPAIFLRRRISLDTRIGSGNTIIQNVRVFGFLRPFVKLEGNVRHAINLKCFILCMF